MDFGDREVSHASMMFQGTGSTLAGATVEFVLQMDGTSVESFAPGDVCRAEQGDDRHVEWRREMARSRIGRDQQIAVFDGRFGEPQAQRLIGQ